MPWHGEKQGVLQDNNHSLTSMLSMAVTSIKRQSRNCNCKTQKQSTNGTLAERLPQKGTLALGLRPESNRVLYFGHTGSRKAKPSIYIQRTAATTLGRSVEILHDQKLVVASVKPSAMVQDKSTTARVSIMRAPIEIPLPVMCLPMPWLRTN